MTTERIASKKAYLEVIETIARKLEDMREDAITDFRKVGKSEKQATNWQTGELLWEDEAQTIPKYEDKWENVRLNDNELSLEQRAKLDAITEIEKALDKLI